MVLRSFLMQSGKICSSRHSFFWPSRHALCTSVPSVQRVARIRRSSRQHRNPIIFSCGSMLCSRCCLLRWKRLHFSLVRYWSSSAFFFFRSFSVQGEKGGGGGPPRCCWWCC